MIILSGAVGSGAVLAGCLDDDEEVDDENDVGDDLDDEDPLDMDAIDGHLADANGWEGELQDHRGEDELGIEVGDPDQGPDYQFNPVCPEIDVGTQVTWEWVDDQDHSVTEEDGAFDSGVEGDYTFEHTFEEPGTVLYYCQPHRAVGHLGALVVYDE